MIPSEVTSALNGVSRAFTEALPKSPATRDNSHDNAVAAQAAADAAHAAKVAAEAVASAADTDTARHIPATNTQP